MAILGLTVPQGSLMVVAAILALVAIKLALQAKRGRLLRCGLLLLGSAVVLSFLGGVEATLPNWMTARQCVIVFSRIEPEALRAVISEFESHDAIVLCRLSPNSEPVPNCGLQLPVQWSDRDSLLEQLERATDLDECAGIEILELGPATEPIAFLECIKQIHSLRWKRHFRPTRCSTLLIPADDEIWTAHLNLQSTETNIGEALRNPRSTLYVLSDVGGASGRLHLEMEQGIVRATTDLAGLPNRCFFRLEGRPDIPSSSLSDVRNVEIFLDGIAITNARSIVEAPRPSVRNWVVRLSSLSNNGYGNELAEGFHRLEIVIDWQVGGEFRGAIFFRAIQNRIVIIEDEGRPSHGTLPLGWGDAMPALERPVTDAIRNYRSENRTQLRTYALGEISHFTWTDLEARRDELSLKLGQDNVSLVLVQPTAFALNSLLVDSDIKLQARIEDGLSLLVVGLPADAASPSLPSWFASGFTRPEPSGADSTKFIFDDLRIYFCPSNSHFMRFQSGDLSEAKSGLHRQCELIRKFYESADAKWYDRSPAFHSTTFPLTVNSEGTAVTVQHTKRDDGGNRVGTAYSTAFGDAGLASLFILDALAPDDRAANPNWTSAQTGVRVDLLPVLADRLESILDTDNRGVLRPVERTHRYPNTFVVVIVSGLSAHFDEPSRRSAVERLKNLGVRFLFVRMKPTLDIVGYYEANKGPDAQPLAPLALATFELDCQYDEQPKAIAEALVHTINLHTNVTKVQMRSDLGRVIDDRVQSDRIAPRQRESVSGASPGPYDFAWVGTGGTARPLIQSRIIGEGRVTVLHYSPVSFDVWRGDHRVVRTLPDRIPRVGFTDTLPEADGWGLQRFVDLVTLNSAGFRLGSTPVLKHVEELSDGSTLLFHCWATPPNPGESWPIPDLLFDSGEPAVSCSLRSIHPLSTEATFAYRATQERNERACLRFGDSQVELAHVRLVPASSSFGASTTESLQGIATMSGGGVVAIGTLSESIAQSVNLTRQISLLLPTLALVCLSPLCRSWFGFMVMIRRERARSDRATLLPSPRAIESKVSGVLTKWGRHPGIPDAQRHAGTIAGERPFQSGDSLAVSKLHSLVPLTPAGKNLPPKRPIVRIRHANRAMQAMIVGDVGPNLHYPRLPQTGEKAECLCLVSALVASVVWRQSGSVAASTLQTSQEIWGPHFSEDSRQELIRYMQRQISKRSNECRLASLPEGVLPGQTLFLISGLTAFRDADVNQLALNAVVEDIDLRVIHLYDSSEATASGLCRDVVSGQLFDRTDRTQDFLSTLLLTFSKQLGERLTQSAFKFVRIDARAPLSQSLDQMFDLDFFA